MNRTRTIGCGLLCLVWLLPRAAAAQEPPGVRPPPWVDRVQTYAMVPLLPETARQMHISVNGIWAGISSDHPILPSREMVPSVRKKYDVDAATFVQDCRDAGLIVCGIVNGIEGMESLREAFPHLDTMACRKADGTPARNDEWLLMCTNNPDWIEAEVELGKRSIDAGADVLHLDTPMGAAFLSGGFLKAGFCDHCLARFVAHLTAEFTPEERQQQLGVEQFDRRALVDRLSPFQQLDAKIQPFVNNTPDDLLFREFIRCQERASFETRKQVLVRLRRYAADQNRAVAFSTNAADLGTMNAFGHWIRGIMFADLVDFFVYEQDVLPQGFPAKQLMPLPRGKWAAYHKLAHAIHGRRSPAVIHASQMGQLLMDVMVWRKRTTSAWLGALAAEAYAANGAFIMYHVEAPFGLTSGLKRFWAETGRLNHFVHEHAEFYNGPPRSGSSLACVVLFNERGRTVPAAFPSYLGLAQAFVEGNYPFDVIFAGDGRYVRDRLQQNDLRHYSTIVVPSPIQPTENQIKVIEQFVRAGGTLVTQEPQRLGITGVFEPHERGYLAGALKLGDGLVLQLAGDVTPTATNDVGSRFFQSYATEPRDQIHDLAELLGLTPLLGKERKGLIAAFPIVQPQHQRTVVHLVNYDVDLAKDKLREGTDVTVTLSHRFLPAGRRLAELFAPGVEGPQPVPLQDTADGTSCTIPRLGSAATLVIRAD